MTLQSQGLSDTASARIYKEFSGVSAIAFSTHIMPSNIPTTLDRTMATLRSGNGSGTSNDISLMQYTALSFNGLLFGSNPSDPGGKGFASAIAEGDLSDIDNTSEIYFCAVMYNNVLKSFVSKDGVNWIQTSTENIECLGAPYGCTNKTQIIDYNTTGWTEFQAGIYEETNNSSSYSVPFKYVRFNSTGIAGTSEDCPVF